jgi:hypothetical protein
LEFFVAVSVSKITVVADVHETPRQNVEKEPSQKLHSVQSHRAMTAIPGVVLPMESNFAAFTTDEPLIGDSDSVGVSREVLEYVFGATKRGLGANYPIFFP